MFLNAPYRSSLLCFNTPDGDSDDSRRRSDSSGRAEDLSLKSEEISSISPAPAPIFTKTEKESPVRTEASSSSAPPSSPLLCYANSGTLSGSHSTNSSSRESGSDDPPSTPIETSNSPGLPSASALSAMAAKAVSLKDDPPEAGSESEICLIQCGQLKGYLHLTRFRCPGIHQCCIELQGHWVSPKQMTVMAAKDKQKDWKGAIKLHGQPLRTLMERKELDFYQHEKFCSGRCVSKNNRLLGSDFPGGDQQSNISSLFGHHSFFDQQLVGPNAIVPDLLSSLKLPPNPYSQFLQSSAQKFSQSEKALNHIVDRESTPENIVADSTTSSNSSANNYNSKDLNNTQISVHTPQSSADPSSGRSGTPPSFAGHRGSIGGTVGTGPHNGLPIPQQRSNSFSNTLPYTSNQLLNLYHTNLLQQSRQTLNSLLGTAAPSAQTNPFLGFLGSQQLLASPLNSAYSLGANPLLSQSMLNSLFRPGHTTSFSSEILKPVPVNPSSERSNEHTSGESSFAYEQTQVLRSMLLSNISCCSDPVLFWTTASQLGLLNEILKQIQEETDELLNPDRFTNTAKTNEAATKLSKLVEALGLQHKIYESLTNRRNTASSKSHAAEYNELKRRASEQERIQMAVKRKSELLDHLVNTASLVFNNHQDTNKNSSSENKHRSESPTNSSSACTPTKITRFSSCQQSNNFVANDMQKMVLTGSTV